MWGRLPVRANTPLVKGRERGSVRGRGGREGVRTLPFCLQVLLCCQAYVSPPSSVPPLLLDVLSVSWEQPTLLDGGNDLDSSRTIVGSCSSMMVKVHQCYCIHFSAIVSDTSSLIILLSLNSGTLMNTVNRSMCSFSKMLNETDHEIS